MMVLSSCLIIDDEPLARNVLETYITDCPQIELKASLSNAIEGSQYLLKQNVDILFLDINMPKLSGIQMFKSLPDPPLVIFTTAYPEFAVEGFELNAVDYLVKPISFERFYKALNKAINKLQLQASQNQAYIVIKSDKKLFKVFLEDICYVEAFGDYLKVNCIDKTLLVHQTLKDFLKALPQHEFMRIHKSYIINLNKIDYIEGNQVSILENCLPISQSYRSEFFERI